MAIALPRFSLRQLLTLVTAVSIALTLILCALSPNGPSPVYNSVICVTFSPDGKNLATVVYHARDAQVFGKRYVADVSDAIAMLDTATLCNCKVITHKFRKGNQGPDMSFRRTSVSFHAEGKRLHVRMRYEEQIRTWDVPSGRWSNDRLESEPNSSGFKPLPDAKYSAVATRRGVEVRDVRTGELVRTVHQSLSRNCFE